MNYKTKPKRRPKAADPASQTIGLHTLKGAGFKMVGYIIVIGCIIIYRPPIWAIMIIISAWTVIVSLYYKRFKLKKQLIGLLYINTFIITFYVLYRMVGGVWATVIAHIFGVALIIYLNRKLIRRAQQQINTLAKDLRKRKGWDK